MSRIKCFWLSPTKEGEVSLRRYQGALPCPGKYGYHNASVIIGKCEYTMRAVHVTEEMKKEPQWPTKCDYCDYVFQDADTWQWNEEQLYKKEGTEDLYTLRKAPVGAMWDAHWFKRFTEDSGFKKRPDGIVLVVMTPGGDWCVDGPSNNGNGWDRSGTVPEITAHPSILIGTKYHGWLRNGWLEEC